MVDQKSKLGILIAALVVLVLLIAAWWYYNNRYGTVLVSSAAEGTTESLTCTAGQSVSVVSASYTPSGGKAVDVKDALSKILTSSTQFTVSGVALGQPAGGTLTFRYRCGAAPAAAATTKSGFRPVPDLSCAASNEYAVKGFAAGHRDNMTVTNPYSAIAAWRGAESPEVAERMNPVTGVGMRATVRALGDRYRYKEALQAISNFELPGRPGNMEAVEDSMLGFSSSVSRRSPGTNIPSQRRATLDTNSFEGNEIKEGLTSSRQSSAQNALTGLNVGLGSTYRDPRFEPGSSCRLGFDEASPSHGGHSGGPTLGGITTARFQAATGWDHNRVHGFRSPAETLVTDPATWAC